MAITTSYKNSHSNSILLLDIGIKTFVKWCKLQIQRSYPLPNSHSLIIHSLKFVNAEPN